MVAEHSPVGHLNDEGDRAWSWDEVGVVVVNYGSADLVVQNLAPLLASLPLLRLVVVDNFSTEVERAKITALAADRGWVLESPSANLGFGDGMNLGVSRARELGCRFFVLINPDAAITGADLARLLDRSAESTAPTLVAPKILRPDGSLWFGGSDLYLDDGRIRSARRRIDGSRTVPWLTGALLVADEALWDLVEGFGQGFFLYWEDVDLSFRVQEAGGVIDVVDEATAVHAEGGTQSDPHTSAGAPKSDLYYYFNIRNRMLFGGRHLDRGDYRRWMLRSPRVAWEILLQGGRRQLLQSRRPVIAALRGLRDGWRLGRKEQRARGI